MAGSSESNQNESESMSHVVSSILNDLLYNIVSDTVLNVHREEKIMRMQSAATIAQAAQEKASEEEPPTGEALQVISTAGATAQEDGTIYIHGNPFKTTPEVICPICRLPRLQHPVTGANSQPPEPGRAYCSKQPYIDKPGCDIYGHSLDLEKATKKKAAKVTKAKNDPSPDDSKSPSPTSKDNDKSTTLPTGKCPACNRYLKYSRFAQHLSSCMKVGGRHASINARGKIKDAATPRDSRASTPKIGVTKKRRLDKGSEDDEEESTPKKKKKPFAKKKPPAGKKPGEYVTKKGVHSNIQRVKGAEKRLPGQSESDSREQPPVAKGKMKEKVAKREETGSADEGSFKDEEE